MHQKHEPARPAKRSTAAGETKIGIVQEGLGLRSQKLVWYSSAELIARFGLEGAKVLAAAASEWDEST